MRFTHTSDFHLPLTDLLDFKAPLDTPTPWEETENRQFFSQAEDTYPATTVQCEIAKEPVQWAKSELSLGSRYTDLGPIIVDAWRALASYHSCLRAALIRDSDSTQLKVVVYRRIEDIVPLGNQNKYTDERLAHLTFEISSRGKPKLYLNFRRALIDGTSLKRVSHDFILLLRGLPPLEHTGFGSYLRFLSRLRNSDESREFWSKTLGDAVPRPLLPRRAATKRAHGESAGTKASITEIVDKFDLPQDIHMSRQMFFELVWALVLRTHTGSDDVMFGAVRRDPYFVGVDNCIGHLDQTYLVRLATSNDDLIETVTTRLRQFHDTAASHAFVGLDEIRRRLPPGVDVDSVVTYSQVAKLPHIAPGLVSFPVALNICDSRTLAITLTYSDEIDSSAADILLQHFVTALRSAAAIEHLESAPCSLIKLISDGERTELLSRAGTGKSAVSSTINSLFEKAVSLYSSKVAVEFGGAKLTFEQLNSLANSVANTLQLQKGAIVPILMDRSLELIVSILAVLKSGAAYTILDPESPTQRLEQLTNDCSPPLIIAHRKYSHLFPQANSIEDILSAAKSNPSTSSSPNVDIRPEDKCYVIYTSGSTGKPKGAVLTHGAAASGMANHTLNGLSRWLLFYNLSFSAAQRTMLSTLVHGGTLLIATKEKMATDLAGVINDLRVEALGITPSALSLLRPADVPNLKQVVLVGERIPGSLVDIWSSANIKVRNTYGLSECTQLNFGRQLEPKGNPRVIGNPADTTSAYVLQPGSAELCPTMVAGELCLAGPQLASGYLNQPGLTAKVFVDNPFGPGKLYRTGDMARRLPDFQIEILGRLDLQVKINGQKVEPAEVDRCLLEHDAVSACASVAAEIDDGHLVLVAALVFADGRSLSSELSSIRQHIQSRVPGYMVPSYWLPLDEIPKNANGKTDYQKLKKMVKELGISGLARLLAVGDSNTPLNETEVRIAKVWASVIGIDLAVIGRQSSFPAMGGNSLQAIKAVSELRRAGLIVDYASILSEEPLEKVALSCQLSNGEEDQELPSFSLLDDSESASRLSKTPGVVDAYPATPFQASLLASIDSDSDPYTYQRVWDIQGLDIGRLRNSFEQVFRAREILRTGFIPHGKTLLQIVRDDWALPWHETPSSLEDYLAQDNKQKLSLSGPLFRLAVVSQQYLVVTMHHSLFDFWSHGFLYEDVTAVYLGKEALHRPRFQKFVQHLLSQNKPDSLKFWRKSLQDASPSCLNYAPVLQRARIQTRLNIALTKEARSLGCSAGAIIYAAWATLLSRHLGTQDVVFGTTLSGREAPVLDIQKMDGPTMTTVPQRVKVDPDMSLVQLTNTVQSQFASVVKHSHVGLQEALRSAGAQSGLFDTLVNILVKNEDAEGKDAQNIFKRHGKRQFWDSEFVVLEVEESQRDGSMQVRLAGDMEQHRLEFLAQSFLAIIDVILRNPYQKTGELDIMGASERTYLQDVLSNRSTLHMPAPELLHAAFERWAHESPETVAIDWEGTRHITYTELNQVANQVANILVQRGVKPGDNVPLMLRKSVDTVVSLLGVMKAGAAYVPLNPDNPVQRNSFIVEDTGAKLIVIHKEYADFVASVPGLQALFIDEVSLTSVPRHPPCVPISPDHLAYIIYTSGSTGQPKGVKVPHRSASAAVTSMAAVEGRHRGTWRTLQFANYVFDASVQDFFNTLSTGGTLCMAPTERLLSDIVGCINAMNVKQAIITPTVARLFKPADVPGFERLIVGGEPLTHDVVEMWKPKCQILNVYGPTETSMVVTTKDVQLGGWIGNIGAPFPTVMAFILAPDGQGLVPYGAVGELCIGGPQVTAGYVNRDDLTSAAYVTNDDLGVRLYRTGDLARWLPGGEIECLGRKDNQVKVHGHRIELGEVESAIRKTGLVKDVVALVSKFDDNPRLAAFCIFREEDSPEPQDVGEHVDAYAALRAGLGSLATYMVPKFVIPVGSFPKLPSRKVDRKTLQKMLEELGSAELSRFVLETATDSHEVVPTESPAEEALERMWSDLFKIPTTQIGREASFLTLGGDSIYAISLASMARQAGYTLSVPNILRYPKLKDLAASMQQVAGGDAAETRVFEIPPVVQERLDAAELKLGEDIEYVYPCPPGQTEFLTQGSRLDQMWVLQAVRRMPASADPERWLAATRALTKANDILRTTYLQVAPGKWVGCVLRSADPDVVRVPCGDQTDATVVAERIWAERFAFPYPFIRYAILSYPSGEWDVLIKMDHAVYDGTLLRVFDTHFAAILEGKPVPPHTEFRDFTTAAYQAPRAASLRHWTATLQDKAPDRLLARNPAPKIAQFVKEVIPTPGIDEAASAMGVTSSVLFQGAFELWLSRFLGGSGSSTADVSVSYDYLISGRNVPLPDPQSINGTLATFLPVRSRLDADAAVPEFLGRVQDDFWAMTEHADVGLDEIYAAAGLSREVYGNSVLFLFQPFDPAAEAKGKPEDRWLVMAQSRVRMYQPYALVVEVAKAVGKAHVLKVMYDPDMFDREFAGRVVREIEQIVTKMIDGAEKGEQARVEELLE